MKTARTQAGYTMIEIALAIAVIGFALVAIVGVLPSGMQVQKDNREDTIINQDGIFWLEAIRSGSTGSEDLPRFVEFVVHSDGVSTNRVNTTNPGPRDYTNSLQIIGTLTAPRFDGSPHRGIAQVRAISGPAVMRDNKDVNFKYQIHSSIMPVGSNSNLFEIRLSFYWPILPNGDCGNRSKVLRTQVAGTLFRIDSTNDFWLIQPNKF